MKEPKNDKTLHEVFQDIGRIISGELFEDISIYNRNNNKENEDKERNEEGNENR